MPAYKDRNKGTWYASFYCDSWTGTKQKKLKRGFKTKRDALEWEREFLQQKNADLNMTFANFVVRYTEDQEPLQGEHLGQQRAHYRNKAAALFRKAENVQYYGAADYYLAE